MKRYPPRHRAKARHPRVAGFVPVLQRDRADGWTADRQARFLAALALTRSVSAAARRVGMARETAYRLRRKPGAESFAAAWDRAIGRAPVKRKVTIEERRLRALAGLLKPRMYRGEHVGTELKVDNCALLGFLGRIDRAERGCREASERSQSFDAVLRSAELPLPPVPMAPIYAVRRIPDAERWSTR